MAYAKPNSARKRINKISRVVMAQLGGARGNPRFARKHTYPASDAQIKAAVDQTVARWQSVKHSGKEAKAAAGFGRGDANDWYAHITSGAAKTPSAGEKAMRAKVKREVAKALGLSQKRATQGKGVRYKNGPIHNITEEATYFGGKVKSRRRKVPKKPKGVQAKDWYAQIGGKPGYKDMYSATKFAGYNQDRVNYRSASGEWYDDAWHAPIGPGVSTWKGAGPYKASGAILAGKRGGGVYTPKPRKGKKRGPNAWNLLQKQASAMGINIKGKKRAQIEAEMAGRSNPFVGDLALTNPGFGGVTQYLSGYAVPVALSGAAAGAVHAIASTSGWTETLAETAGKIPVVGEFVEYNMPYTLQGLLVGTGLAMAAPMLGGTAGKYLALTGGAALVFGGGIDAFNFMLGEEDGGEVEDMILDEELDDFDLSELDDFDLEETDDVAGLAFGDLALENISSLGDLALENTSALGGFASLSAPSPLGGDYGQCSYADAYYSGADFSGVEGQALLNGRSRWMRKFGSPTVRAGRKTSNTASHHAGKAGHRWGWLIRTVGWQKAKQISSLPPRKRIRLIHKLRQAAIATYQELLTDAHALQAEAGSANAEFVAPAAGTAAAGANGATNYLGDPALFMGA
jgi:hypothetical protein